MGKKREALGRYCQYFLIFVIVVLLLGYFCILLYNISQDIPVLQTYYVDSYDPKNRKPIPVPDIIFQSDTDFDIDCEIGRIDETGNCNDSIYSIVINEVLSGDPTYVKIFHEPDSTLEFQLEKHITNDNNNSVSYVGFYLNSTSEVVIQLFDREYNPFLGKEEDLVNYNFDSYDVFDKSIALLNFYLLQNNQQVNMYFSRSLMETIDNWNAANVLGFPPVHSSKYSLSTRPDIPITTNGNLSVLPDFRLFLTSTVLTQTRQKRVATIYAAFSLIGGLWSPLAGIFFFLFRKSLVDAIFPCITTNKDEYNKGDKGSEV